MDQVYYIIGTLGFLLMLALPNSIPERMALFLKEILTPTNYFQKIPFVPAK